MIYIVVLKETLHMHNCCVANNPHSGMSFVKEMRAIGFQISRSKVNVMHGNLFINLHRK